ncbi:MAG: hypothetical protein IJ251_07250, partial [Oscillospiraceae bacterium]|nr:hypothetical protein [Oscillospiraceae bacterium]
EQRDNQKGRGKNKIRQKIGLSPFPYGFPSALSFLYLTPFPIFSLNDYLFAALCGNFSLLFLFSIGRAVLRPFNINKSTNWLSALPTERVQAQPALFLT